MKIQVAVVIVGILAGCGSPAHSPKTPLGAAVEKWADQLNAQPSHESYVCGEEANRAVLDKVFPLLEISSSSRREDFDRVLGRIACIREWSVGLKDLCMAGMYEKWLRFYEDDIKAKISALSVPDHKSVEDAEREAMERRVVDFKKAHPVPEPPSCERQVIGQLAEH